MQECDSLIIGGNHDLACVGKYDPNKLNEIALAALFWTRDQLSFTELDQLRRLLLTETLEPFTLAHGTLKHPERFDYLIDMAQAIETIKVCRTLICMVAHTHIPFFLEYDQEMH